MRSGFTLIETIIYLAITSIILTSLISVTYQILSNGKKLEERTLMMEEGDFMIHKINWELKEPTDISNFTLEDGNLLMQEDGGDPLPLNASAVTVSDLIFTNQDNFIKTSFKVDNQPFETIKYFR